MVKKLRAALMWSVASVALLLSGCASTKVSVTGLDAEQTRYPLCPKEPAKASIAVVWGTQWRPDQKEPLLREDAAQRGLVSYFSTLPCGPALSVQRLPTPFVLEGLSEQAAFAKLPGLARVANKVVLISVRELGPKLLIGLPTLVEGGTEVVFDVMVLDAKRGTKVAEFKTHWQHGGPFYIKGVKSLDEDLVSALKASF
ncbi:MAG: hypothetical protein ACK4F8_06295 [Aquabacterium sp.]